MDSRELKDIITGCVRSERRSQKELYDLFSAKMYGICLKYEKDKEKAQDILHDAFFKVYKKISQYEDGNFEAWMSRLVVNTALDYLKKNKRIVFDENIEESDFGYVSNIEEGFQTSDLQYIINLLPLGAKTVFNLYAVEGYNHNEISVKLDISPGTSKSQYSRARSLLQGLVNKHYKQ